MPGLRHSTPEGVRILPLQENVTIGRDARNDLALPDDPMVSHQHARVRQVGDRYIVEDLQSTNGTFLERGLKVTRITSPQRLRPNDVIRVGSTRLVFDMGVTVDAPPATHPATEPDAPAPEEPDVATEVLGETRVGRILPVFMEPPQESESAPSPQLDPPTLQEAAQRIAELEQQLAELRTQLTKKQGDG